MTPDERQAAVSELTAAFGEAADVSPDPAGTLHVLLSSVDVLPPWQPRPTRALVVFEGWPGVRPQFYVDPALANPEGEPPRSYHDAYLIGEPWRGFSFAYPWPDGGMTATEAVLRWLNRFREAS